MRRPIAPSLILTVTALAFGCGDSDAVPWWKGNLHTHSLWSDGDHYPEMVLDWYKTNGYHFVQLSEHNTLAEGEKWISVARRGGEHAYDAYETRFPADWIVEREDSAGTEVRLKTFMEYRGLFDEPGRFLVLQGEELTDGFESRPVHLNATNLLEMIPPQHGSSITETLQRSVAAVLEQRARTGQPMLVQVNHPNYGWALTAEDIIPVASARFFEVYNGHPSVHNEGDTLRPSTEQMWDLILANRLSRGMAPIYGLAVDDAHHYQEFQADRANPGRGWIMVRSSQLTPEALVEALERGDFYGSTGVVLDNVAAESGRYGLRIHAEPDVRYTTQFIGTRRGYSESEVGVVLAEVIGTEPAYQFRGDELYVRATVVSSRLKGNSYREGELEVAWVQPVIPTRD